MIKRVLTLFLLVTCIVAVLAQRSDLPASVLQRAKSLLAEHKSIQAAELLQNYLLRNPADAATLTLLAQIDVDRGQLEEARRLLVDALRASPASVDANLLAGSLLFKAHEYPQAMDRLETVLVRSPRHQEARRLERESAINLAAQTQTAGNQKAALRVLEHAREKMPDDPELLLALGMLAYDTKDLNEAAEALEVALKLSPGSPDLHYGLALIRLDQRQMPAAEAQMRSYLVLRPQDASAHFGLGHIYAMNQRNDEARTEFEQSIQLQPIQTEAYYQIGQLELNDRHYDKARSLFLRVVARNPDHGGALTGLGEIEFRAHRYEQAQQYLEPAVKVAPEYAPAHYYLGLVFARLGKKAESEQQLRLATQLGHDTGLPSSAP